VGGSGLELSWSKQQGAVTRETVPWGEGGQVVVGRKAARSIDSQYLSKEHLRVLEEVGQLWLEDLGSNNGTYLLLVEPLVLGPETRVRMGIST
jgi:hypothetical protein